MGQIRKVGDLYYIEFNARGLMYSQVAGETEEGARKLLEEVEGKIAQGESLTVSPDSRLDIFFERFLAYAQDRFSKKSLDRFTSTWNHWLSFLAASYPGINQLSQVTPAVIESYKTSIVKTSKPKIVNLTILLLREIFEYGIRIGFINDNPSLHISLLPLPLRQIRNSPRSELAKDMLHRHVSIEKIYLILKLKDVAGIIYWSNFIPLKREDVYN